MTTTIEFSRGNGEWLVGGTPAHKHVTKFDKGSGEQKLMFKLSDDAKKAGFHFHEDDPIWVHADATQCPKEPVKDGQITDIDGHDHHLSVTDKNDQQVILRYQLNVVDSEGNASPIDPIIDNGGHGFQ